MSTLSLSWSDGAAAKPDESYSVKCVLSGGCAGPAEGVSATNITRGVQRAWATALAPGTSYNCFVVATNAAGSTCSAPIAATTWSVPVAPSNLTTPFTNTTAVTVTWSDGTTAVPAQSYAVKCVLPGAGCSGAAQGSQVLNQTRGVQSATIGGLVPGTSYDCYVQASNAAGSTCSSKLVVTSYIEPSPPTGAAVSALTSTNATLTWTDAPAATPTQTYQVKCVTAGGVCTAPPIASSVSGILRGVGRTVVANLTAGTPYTCFVVATNAVSSSCSGPVSFTTYTVPVAPTSATSTAQTVNTVTLGWVDGAEASPPQVYEVRCTDAGGTCSSPVVGNSATGIVRTTRTGLVSGLASGRTYACFVVASNSAGAACSAAVNVTTYNLPPPVTAVNATAITTGSVALAWNDGAAALPLQVQDVRCVLPGAGCNGTPVGTGAANIARGTRSGSVTGLTAGTRYDCFVRSSNAAGASCSDAVDVTTYVGPGAPTAVAAPSLSATTVTLTWSDGAAAVPRQTLAVKCVASGAACSAPGVGFNATVDYGVQTGTVTGLTQGTPYSCYVVASNIVASASCSAAVAVTTYTVPPPPTSVTSTALTVSSATLGWLDGGAASPVQLYEAKCVSAGLPCNATGEGTGQVRISRTTQSALVTGLVSGANYSCYIVASNAAGSACSTPLGITTYSVPVGPAGLNATQVKKGKNGMCAPSFLVGGVECRGGGHGKGGEDGKEDLSCSNPRAQPNVFPPTPPFFFPTRSQPPPSASAGSMALPPFPPKCTTSSACCRAPGAAAPRKAPPWTARQPRWRRHVPCRQRLSPRRPSQNPPTQPPSSAVCACRPSPTCLPAARTTATCARPTRPG